MKIYFQNQILPAAEARVSASDHGLLFGLGLFETFRTLNGHPILLAEHLQRMRAGCEAFHISPPPDSLLAELPPFPKFRETIRQLLHANNLPDAVFRFTLTAGEAAPGLPVAPYTDPIEILHIRPLPPPLPPSGQRLHILNTTRTEPETFPRPKSAHYANSLAAHRELQQRSPAPGDEGLMLTRDGRLAEGIVSNLFLIDSDGLKTPDLSANILPGITRAAVLRLAETLAIPARETALGLCDLTEADAVFTTNSTRGLVPVSEILSPASRPLWRANSAQNPTLQSLTTAYQTLTTSQTT